MLQELAQRGQRAVPEALVYAMITLVSGTDREAVIQQLSSSKDLQAVTAVQHLKAGRITVVDIGETLRGADRISDYNSLIQNKSLHEALSKVSSNCIMSTSACAGACSADTVGSTSLRFINLQGCQCCTRNCCSPSAVHTVSQIVTYSLYRSCAVCCVHSQSAVTVGTCAVAARVSPKLCCIPLVDLDSAAAAERKRCRAAGMDANEMVKRVSHLLVRCEMSVQLLAAVGGLLHKTRPGCAANRGYGHWGTPAG
jgi:hypothetical protein